MTVALDATTRWPVTDSSGTDTTTGDRTFTHTPTGTPKGVVVIVNTWQSSSAPVTGVLYGSVAMTQVGSSNDTSETGWCGVYVLTSGVPTGAQTVTMQGCTASNKYASCFTLTTGGGDTSVDTSSFINTTTAANAGASLTTAGTCFIVAGIASGVSALPTAATGCTHVHSLDLGQQVALTVERSIIESPGTYVIGYTTASDDYCVSAVAVTEVTAAVTSQGTVSTAIHPGRGTSNIGRFFQRAMSTDGPPIVTVNADVATGTGTAYDAQAAVGVNAETTTGTGTAYDATVEVDVNADMATGAGAAYDATIVYDPGPGAFSQSFHPGRGPSSVGRFFQRAMSTDVPAAGSVNAETTTGTGVAFDATIAITVNAESPTGTGTSFDAQAAVGVNAETTIGTGTSYDAQPAVGVNADIALGTGVAYDAQAAITVNADVAAGAGAAFDAAPSVGVNAETTTGVGVANDAAADVQVNADVAAGTGVAYDATVTVDTGGQLGSVSRSFHPGLGPSNVGRFFQRPMSTDIPLAGTAFAEATAGTGTAFDATVAVTVNAETTTGTGAALDAQPGVGGNADVATGTGNAFDGTITITVNAETTAGVGVAYDATVSVGVLAEMAAAASGVALDATLAIAGAADVAVGAGFAFDATVVVVEAAPSVGGVSQSFHPGRGPSNAGRFYQRPQSTFVPDTGFIADLQSSDSGLVLISGP